MDRTKQNRSPADGEHPHGDRKRRRWLMPAVWVMVPLLAIAGVVTLVETTTSPAETRPSNAIATGEIVGGRHVAVLAYETDTFPHVDLFRIGSIGYSVQATAFDLDTGERLWDTMLSNDFPSIGAEALAVGGGYAYVRTDDGLVILDVVTGGVVARDEQVPGLEDDYVASRTSYAYDEPSRQVVLRDRDDAVLAIPVGSVTAKPAPAEVSLRWEGELTASEPDRFLYSQTMEDATNDKARLPGPEPEPDPLTGIVPDTNMLHASWAPDDAWTADIVLDPSTGYAAGSDQGFAVSEAHQGGRYTYQVADLETRTAQARLDVPSGAGIDTVTVDAAGYVVMTIPNADQQGLLVIATADSIRASVIGERGWLGS